MALLQVLPQVLALDSCHDFLPQDGLPPQVAFGHGLYHRNRKLARTSSKSTWKTNCGHAHQGVCRLGVPNVGSILPQPKVLGWTEREMAGKVQHAFLSAPWLWTQCDQLPLAPCHPCHEGLDPAKASQYKLLLMLLLTDLLRQQWKKSKCLCVWRVEGRRDWGPDKALGLCIYGIYFLGAKEEDKKQGSWVLSCIISILWWKWYNRLESSSVVYF